MGFDLTNDRGTYVRFSPSGWSLALILAQNYGWEPSGTTLPGATYEVAASWSGEYATNEGQRVAAADAARLADACERALADPKYASQGIAILNDINAVVAREVGHAFETQTSETDMLKFRNRLEELVAFCREGGFVIE